MQISLFLIYFPPIYTKAKTHTHTHSHIVACCVKWKSTDFSKLSVGGKQQLPSECVCFVAPFGWINSPHIFPSKDNTTRWLILTRWIWFHFWSSWKVKVYLNHFHVFSESKERARVSLTLDCFSAYTRKLCYSQVTTRKTLRWIQPTFHYLYLIAIFTLVSYK